MHFHTKLIPDKIKINLKELGVINWRTANIFLQAVIRGVDFKIIIGSKEFDIFKHIF